MARFVRLALLALFACDSSAREEHIAAPVETKKPAEPAPPPKPAGPPTDPTLLDRLLVAEPTYLWSAEERLFACARATRKGQDTTYAFALYDPQGKRIEEPVQVLPGAREFATKRRPIDARLAKGYTALTRVPWPKHGRTLALPDRGIDLLWDESGEIRVAESGKRKPITATKLERMDFVPVAAHIGPPDVALVEVTFDPKDTTTLDVQYTDCAVVPLTAK